MINTVLNYYNKQEVKMKTFYRQFRDRNKAQPTGNIICVFSEHALPTSDAGLAHRQLDQMYNGVGTESEQANGAPCITECSLVYLLVRCSPCTETEARAIHPAIFDLLEIAQHSPMFSN